MALPVLAGLSRFILANTAKSVGIKSILNGI
jgi:hypothetical protein